MAEGILKHLLKSKGIEHIDVSSAGTAGLEGYPPSENAVEATRVWDIDISGHRSRSLNRRLIESADLVLGMSAEHINFILNLSPSARSKTYLIKGFPNPPAANQEGVHDPIGGTLDQYNQTYLELDEILRRAERDIIDLAENAGK